MELRTFVEESFKQIVEAISNSSGFANAHGAIVNPGQHDWRNGDGLFIDDQTGRIITNIDFDVAVTISDKSKSESGGGISVFKIGFNASGEETVSNQSVSKVKFSVPVVFSSSREDNVPKKRKFVAV